MRCNVCVVGDDDQSIYGWRGADPGRILRFQRDFRKARVVTLTQNYRSTQTILDAANRLIAHNQRAQEEGAPLDDRRTRARSRSSSRRTSATRCSFVGGGVQRLIGQGAAPAEIAVLFRTNRQCRPLEVALRSRGIRYRVMGTFSFFDRREVRDLLAYGRAAVNPSDDSAFIRIHEPAAARARRRVARSPAQARGRGPPEPPARGRGAPREDGADAIPDRMRDGLRDLLATLGGPRGEGRGGAASRARSRR